MLANFFSKAKPINYVLLTFLFLFLYVFAFIEFNIAVFTLKIVMFKLADMLLLLILMFLYNFIIYKNKLTANNHFGILFISLLFGAFYPILILTKILLALVFLALSFRRIYSLSIYKNIKEKLFDCGLLIALASLIFQENLLFIFLIYFAMLVFRHFKWNYFFIPIIGFITPYFLIYIYSLSANNWFFFNRIIELNLSFNLEILNNHLILIYALSIAFLSFMSHLLFTINTSVFGNKFKALWILVFFHLLLSFTILFMGNKGNLYNSALLIFPAGIILANYIKTISKKWLKEIFILLILSLSLSRLIYSFVP